MKLLTEMLPIVGEVRKPVGPGYKQMHDAAAAHAMRQAMDEFEANLSLGGIQWVRRRADELMREWGFEE